MPLTLLWTRVSFRHLSSSHCNSPPKSKESRSCSRHSESWSPTTPKCWSKSTGSKLRLCRSTHHSTWTSTWSTTTYLIASSHQHARKLKSKLTTRSGKRIGWSWPCTRRPLWKLPPVDRGPDPRRARMMWKDQISILTRRKSILQSILTSPASS